MPVCDSCLRIPLRKIMAEDSSIAVMPPVPAIEISREKQYYIKLKPSPKHLLASARSCQICAVFSEAMMGAYVKVEEEDERAVWVWSGRRGGRRLAVMLGKDEPEIRISGRLITMEMDFDPTSWRESKGSTTYVQQDPKHPLALAEIETWVAECNNVHAACSCVANSAVQLPTRLLDLDAMPTRSEMKDRDWSALFHTTSCRLVDSGGQKGKYIALSYCWGRSLAYKTTSDNLQQHRIGIQFTALPKTLQDSIFITRWFGIRYIWIDCLCIIQDDKADWEREAARMGDVYSNSYLTVAAMRASASDEGFLQPRAAKPAEVIEIIDEMGPLTFYLRVEDLFSAPGSITSIASEPMRDEPLSSRVWTLQERVLPLRSLHFATTHSYWECNTVAQPEGSSYPFPPLARDNFCVRDLAACLSSSSLHQTTRNPWFQLIQTYTSRNMTYATDKLPALSGILSLLQIHTNDICFAGIWKRHFPEGLLWRPQHPTRDAYVLQPKPPSRPHTWRAPSWSFAALEGVILYDRSHFGTPYCATLEDCRVVPVSAYNPLGEISEGYARMRGPMTRIQGVNIAVDTVEAWVPCGVVMRNGAAMEGNVFFDLSKFEECDVLMLTPYTGIVLRRSAQSEGGEEFVRVGVLQVWHEPGFEVLTARAWPEERSVVLI